MGKIFQKFFSTRPNPKPANDTLRMSRTNLIAAMNLGKKYHVDHVNPVANGGGSEREAFTR
jgi:hypothetical protein